MIQPRTPPRTLSHPVALGHSIFGHRVFVDCFPANSFFASRVFVTGVFGKSVFAASDGGKLTLGISSRRLFGLARVVFFNSSYGGLRLSRLCIGRLCISGLCRSGAFDRRGRRRRVKPPLLKLNLVFPLALEILAGLAELREALAQGLAKLRQLARAEYDSGIPRLPMFYSSHF
jgi:hypothetical protein